MVSNIRPPLRYLAFLILGVRRVGHPGNLMTFHRPDFQNALLRKLPRSTKVFCSKRLRSFTQRATGPVELCFEDGSTASCDVLVGADGLKSAVRSVMYTEKAKIAQSEKKVKEAAELQACVEPLWCGTNAYRALIAPERLNARHPGHRVFTQPTQVRTLEHSCGNQWCSDFRIFLSNQYLGKNGVSIMSLLSGRFPLTDALHPL